jgi:iron(III) transport system permease protein
MLWFYALAVCALFLAPLVGLLSRVQWDHIASLYLAPSFAKSLSVTIQSSLIGGLVSVLLGLLFARQFALHDWRGRRIQRLMLLLPYLIPNFILAIAFVVAWNPTTGLMNFAFKFPYGLYGMFGMTFLFAITHMPVAFLLFEEKLRRIDTSLREAARLSGAGPWQVFLRIDLPLLKPTIVGALGLCFALNISAFAIPAWIAAPKNIYPLTYKIYQAIQLGGLDGIPDAAALSVALFGLALVPLLLGYAIQGNEKKYAVLTGKSAKLADQVQSAAEFSTFQSLYFLTQLLFWMAPILCLFLSTLVKPGCLQSQGLQCFGDISFSRYSYVLWELDETRVALKGSLIYGSIASVFIVLMAILSLAFLSKDRNKVRFLESVFAILISTPGAIIALGLIVVLSGKYGINLYNTPWIAVAAFVLKHMSLAFQPLRTGLANISGSLLEAAQLSGAGPVSVWRRIVIPILQPEILGGFFLVLIPILGELTMSVFLSSPTFKTIGTVLFDLQDYADQGSAAALAILLVILILILNELARLLSKGKLGY